MRKKSVGLAFGWKAKAQLREQNEEVALLNEQLQSQEEIKFQNAMAQEHAKGERTTEQLNQLLRGLEIKKLVL